MEEVEKVFLEMEEEDEVSVVVESETLGKSVFGENEGGKSKFLVLKLFEGEDEDCYYGLIKMDEVSFFSKICLLEKDYKDLQGFLDMILHKLSDLVKLESQSVE